MTDQERFEEWWKEYKDPLEPLISEKDAFLAALAIGREEERKRCAAVLGEMYKEKSLECQHGMSGYSEGYLDALDIAEQQIRGK